MDACTHEVRLNQWKLIIEQCQSRPDGQTARPWMAENGVQEKTYYYWLRRVRKEVYSQLSDGSTSLPAMQEKGTVTFAEVPMIPQQNPEIPFSVLWKAFRPYKGASLDGERIPAIIQKV